MMMTSRFFVVPSAVILILVVLSLLLPAGESHEGSSFSNALVHPPTISSTNGVLETDWSLESSTPSIPISEHSFLAMTTRLFRGMYPGPTLRLKAGDELRVNLTNRLTDQGIPYVHNQLSAPDETNLHYHGLHVSGELPSDDTTHIVKPGETYAYSSQLPANHMGGTHWMHPHRHGSTTIQVAGGAVSAIIVEDAPGVLPPQVENATEVLFLAHQLNLEEMQEVVQDSNDGLWTLLSHSDANDVVYVTVNGQINPIISVVPGEWIRFRVIWAAWLQGHLDFAIPECEMQLLAKDGIYIRDFPRAISSAPIVPAGRADIMVRCTESSQTYTITGGTGGTGVLATIQTTAGPAVESTDLVAWTPDYPDYLADLRTTAASPGCACVTELGGDAVNGIAFSQDNVLHQSYLNAVVEREVDADDHPYHQHVYPFQLVSGFQDTSGYNKIGDWHDTIEEEGVIRYQPTVFTGKIMVHCHRLIHEDEGMMSMEQVNNPTTSNCTCGANNEDENDDLMVFILIAVGFLLLLCVIIYFIYRWRRYSAVP